MSCDRCYMDCSLREVCDREEKLPLTNYEKYFGSPEKVVQAFIDHEVLMESKPGEKKYRGFIAALMGSWAEYALCHHDTFLAWLQEEAE